MKQDASEDTNQVIENDQSKDQDQSDKIQQDDSQMQDQENQKEEKQEAQQSMDQDEQEEEQETSKQRKNRELTYMNQQNIINQESDKPNQKNQQNKVVTFFTKQKQERALDFKQTRKNLDQMKIPQEIDYLFPNKVKVYEKMRDLEQSINNFMKQKLLAVKEDLLQNNAKVKRNLRIMVELTHQHPTQNNVNSWKLRMEGKVINNQSEEELLSTQNQNQRFMNFFEKVKIEFPGKEYPEVEWVKAKCENGGQFDCIEIIRNYSKEYTQRQHNIKVNLHFYLEQNPKKYKLSPQLSKLLGIEEESRIKIIGALWQYIKSNRQQDPDNRDLINTNQELMEIFNEEKIEFHTIISRLKDHLTEVDPFTLEFEIISKKAAENCQRHFYELPVFVYSDSQIKQIEFLINSNYEFYQTSQDDQGQNINSKLALNGNILKKRESKYNMKISNAFEKMKKSYRQMEFFKRMKQDVKQTIQNVIVEQNKWLEVLKDEQQQKLSYDVVGEHENSEFYQQNQQWLISEVENYLKQNAEKVKLAAQQEQQRQEQAQNENDEERSEEKEDLGNKKLQDSFSANNGIGVSTRSGAYNLRGNH